VSITLSDTCDIGPVSGVAVLRRLLGVGRTVPLALTEP
jgi:hypothetical protein